MGSVRGRALEVLGSDISDLEDVLRGGGGVSVCDKLLEISGWALLSMCGLSLRVRCPQRIFRTLLCKKGLKELVAAVAYLDVLLRCNFGARLKKR